MSMILQTLTHIASGAQAASAFAQAASGPEPANIWQPVAASTNAAAVDFVWDVINWICYFFFVLVVALMVAFVIKYRHRAGAAFRTDYPHHNTPLELTWSIVPTLLVIGIFWVGFKGYLDVTTAPKNSYEIQVQAQKWAWNFKYPNGAQSDDLYVPANRPVRLVMRSTDVLHSLYIPDFRVKKDVVPGRYSTLWFQCDYPTGAPSEKGPKVDGHHLFCTEYCGTGHSNMNRKVYVLAEADFNAWLTDQSQWIDKIADDELYSKAGPKIFARCQQCHSLDGSAGIGPTWKGIVDRVKGYPNVGEGKQYATFEDYIRSSILVPGEYVVPGYANAMPTFKGQLNDRMIDAVIGYMKHLDEFDPKTGKYLKAAAK